LNAEKEKKKEVSQPSRVLRLPRGENEVLRGKKQLRGVAFAEKGNGLPHDQRKIKRAPSRRHQSSKRRGGGEGRELVGGKEVSLSRGGGGKEGFFVRQAKGPPLKKKKIRETD